MMSGATFYGLVAQYEAWLRDFDPPKDWETLLLSMATLIATVGIFLTQSHREERRIRTDRCKAARAAGELGANAHKQLSGRLHAIIKSPLRFALRGARTTESIAAMRELDVLMLPAELIADYAEVRAGLFAVNERISEVFRTEKSQARKLKRLDRLESAARIFDEATTALDRLITSINEQFGGSITRCPNSDEVQVYIARAKLNGANGVQFDD